MLVQSPNFFGVIEDIPAIAEIAHKKGALLIVSIAEAVSLGVVRPPVEADIVSMEAQSFGVALSYGGPFCGVIAAKEQYLRQMPGRLAGQTVDGNGNRGFVLTLSTREQHIRREKATSNICTNQALVALMATIFLTVYGKEGIRELAEHNLAKADYAAKTLSAQPGAKLLFKGAPRFHEFVLQTAGIAGAMEPAAAGRQDCRRHRSEPLVSRVEERDALVRDGSGGARNDRSRGKSAGGRTGGGIEARCSDGWRVRFDAAAKIEIGNWRILRRNAGNGSKISGRGKARFILLPGILRSRVIPHCLGCDFT